MKIKNYQIKRYYKIVNVVQIPFNIINYKTFTKVLDKLKEKNRTAASQFLSRRLLMNKKSIKSRFKSFYEKFNQLNFILSKK